MIALKKVLLGCCIKPKRGVIFLEDLGEMSYTKREFSIWLYEDDYKRLYDNWVDEGIGL